MSTPNARPQSPAGNGARAVRALAAASGDNAAAIKGISISKAGDWETVHGEDGASAQETIVSFLDAVTGNTTSVKIRSAGLQFTGITVSGNPPAAANDAAPAPAENTEQEGEKKDGKTGPSNDIVKLINDLKKDHPDNITVQTFDESFYNTLSDELKPRFLHCLQSGYENPDSHMGCYACYVDDYELFKPFFKKALEAYHKVDLSKTKHVNNWSLEGVEGLPADGKLDLAALGLPALSMRVRTGRNLTKFPLPGAMTKEDRINMELAMGKVFEELIAKDGFGGRYVSITPGHPGFVEEKEYQELVDAHIMFKDMSADKYLLSAGIAQDWPHGRGCYIS
jgi:hypothetical protein